MNEETPLMLNASQQATKMRQLSYLASTVCCFLSASFTVFSLYTNVFEFELQYTPLQINYVSIAAEMGLYLCVPPLGYIADAYRLSYVGIVGCVAYVVGYGGCAWVVYTHQSWPLMALFFGIVGIGCSAAFIASLVNCARLFPETALLAISMPTTLYGFSSLMYARVTSLYLESGKGLDSLFVELAVAMFVVGLLAVIAPVWGRVDVSAGPVGAQVSEEIPENAESLVKRFFSDHKMLLFLLSFIFISGPLEMYQNDVGLIVKTSGGTTAQVAHQVALFSGMSTVTRLSVGAIIDVCGVRPPYLLLGVVAVVCVTDFAYAQGWLGLAVTSIVSGMGYGSAFTLYPLMVSQIWGIEGFATNWGMFILGPAIGLLLFGLKFGHDLEQSASVASTFRLCAFVALISFVLVSQLKLHRAYDRLISN